MCSKLLNGNILNLIIKYFIIPFNLILSMLFAQIYFVVNIQIIVTYVSIFLNILNICLSINFNNLLKVLQSKHPQHKL